MNSWRARAACKGQDTRLWFSDQPNDQARALSICAHCPVRTDCLAEAMASPGRRGTWGGLTEGERDALRKTGRVA